MAISSRKWQVDPLQHDVKIAEANGSGTAWFIRQWNLLLALVKQVTSLSQPSGVTPGTYGDSTNVAQVTVDEFGRVTGAQNVPIAAGGAWEIVGTWTYSSAVSSVEFDVTGYTDIIVTAQAVDPSGVARCALQVSSDAGATWFTTSGDYKYINNNGVTFNDVAIALYESYSNDPRSASLQMFAIDTGSLCKVALGSLAPTFTAWFDGAATAINRIRLVMLTSAPANVNFAGGTIQVLGRQA